jgi:hypothetical protein
MDTTALEGAVGWPRSDTLRPRPSQCSHAYGVRWVGIGPAAGGAKIQGGRHGHKAEATL